MRTDFLSKAEWLHEGRVVAYARFLCVLYAVMAALWIGLSPGLVDPQNKPVGTDFMSFWAAGKLALAGHAEKAYDYSSQFEVERLALRWKGGQPASYFPWHNPPIFLLVTAPLAALPYGMALLVWSALTLLAYLATIRSILPYKHWFLVALAFPAVFINLGHGQNGFLTAALMGGGLLLLERRPVAAGLLFGLLAYKPQFGILLPLVLAAGRHWRAFVSAAATTLGIALLSYGVFGAGAWRAFMASLPLTQRYMLEQGTAGWEKIQSIFSAVRMVGGTVGTAYAVQTCLTVLTAAVTVWIWRKPFVSNSLKSAALATATILATPYVLDYDLMLLGLSVAWFAMEAGKTGFLPWEKAGLFTAAFLPLLSRPIGTMGIPIAPFILLILYGLIVRRISALTRIDGLNELPSVYQSPGARGTSPLCEPEAEAKTLPVRPLTRPSNCLEIRTVSDNSGTFV